MDGATRAAAGTTPRQGRALEMQMVMAVVPGTVSGIIVMKRTAGRMAIMSPRLAARMLVLVVLGKPVKAARATRKAAGTTGMRLFVVTQLDVSGTARGITATR